MAEQLSPDKSGFIEVDDFKIYWEYFGKGDKEVVCLLNGVAMYTKSWYTTLQFLLDDYDIILYDYPGQGDSSSDDVPYDIERFCTYLVMIMDELKIEKIHLSGISYGGLVAIEFARMYQERLHTLTISGAFITYNMLYDRARNNSVRMINEAPFDLFAEMLYVQIFSETFFRQVEPMLDRMKEKLQERYADRKRALVRIIETQDKYMENVKTKQDEYKKINVPTLIMCGDEDLVLPPWVQKKIAEVIDNSKFILVENCGHVVYIEKMQLYFANMKKLMKAKSLDFEALNK